MSDQKQFFIFNIFLYIKKIIISFKNNNVKEIPLFLASLIFYILFILCPLVLFYLFKYFYYDLLLWENTQYILQDIFLMSLFWCPFLYLAISFFPLYKEGDIIINNKDEINYMNALNIIKIENNQYHTVSRLRPDVLIKVRIEEDHLYKKIDSIEFEDFKTNLEKEEELKKIKKTRKFEIIQGEKK